MKKNLSTILLVLMLLLGISLLLYPTVSDYWNSIHQTRAVAIYEEEVAGADKEKLERLWQEAVEYNQTLLGKVDRWHPTEAEHEWYMDMLNLSGTGVIGALEIQKIKVSLPIYHGIDEGVLQVAVGHIEGSSLPIGGEGTHSVLSGHRGLPSAKLLTNLNKMTEGDRFRIRVLDQLLTYEVDQIRIVEPDDMSNLKIEEGKDYCTLVTCTPYGVNSHRLLVRGHRVENDAETDVLVASDALQITPLIVASVLAAGMLLVLLIIMLVRTGRQKARKK